MVVFVWYNSICYGFVNEAEKDGEGVYFKNMRALTGDLLKDYPLISMHDRRKFLLAIYPRFIPNFSQTQYYETRIIKDMNWLKMYHILINTSLKI